MKRSLGFLLIIACSWFIFTEQACTTKEPNVIRVSLERNDNEMLSIGMTFTFDEKRVAEAREKYKPTLPDPLPDNARITFSPAGPFFGLVEKKDKQPKIKLTLDVNMNQNLTDDTAIELSHSEDWEEGKIVKIARTYDEPEKHTEWLPYRIGYSVDKGRDGKVRENIFICSNYRYEGEFRLNNRDYAVHLMDGDVRGRFIMEKLVNVYVWLGLKSEIEKPGAGSSHRLYELVQLGDNLYKFKGLAEDGSWIELEESSLPTTALGKPAPDMEMTDLEGQSFRLSDYRGKLLLLDFWYAGCKPCIAKFPDIKKMIQSYEDKPFVTIGVNIDAVQRVDKAKKVIADYELSWRQVVEGKGRFLPVYQVYGRMPERPMSFPIYVAIDEEGITRYATNDFKKMGRFLEAHYANPKDPQRILFIPLSRSRSQQSRPVIAVDFTSPKVKSLLKKNKMKIPEGISEEARTGLLPNGTVLIAQPAASSDKIHLILDSNRDFDLTNDEGKDIPVLNEPVTDDAQTTKMSLNISFASGARGFYTLYFFARPAAEEEAFPEVLFRGFSQRYEGSFFAGKKEYSIEIHDPSGDFLFTEEDSEDPEILKLKVKKKDDWETVHQGIRQIPIGDSLYRLRSISDHGQLVELEKEK
jgi:peroxiredoxin